MEPEDSALYKSIQERTFHTKFHQLTWYLANMLFPLWPSLPKQFLFVFRLKLPWFLSALQKLNLVNEIQILSHNCSPDRIVAQGAGCSGGLYEIQHQRMHSWQNQSLYWAEMEIAKHRAGDCYLCFHRNKVKSYPITDTCWELHNNATMQELWWAAFHSHPPSHSSSSPSPVLPRPWIWSMLLLPYCRSPHGMHHHITVH